MKLIIYFSAIFSIILFSYTVTEVSAQGFLPFYGGGQLTYSDSHNDDDLGLLLTVLLLATRNRGNGGCCGCCNCGSNNIPIPYPIPIPTNNPIITNSRNGDYGDGGCNDGNGDVVNVITENESNVSAEADSSNDVRNENDNESMAQSSAQSAIPETPVE